MSAVEVHGVADDEEVAAIMAAAALVLDPPEPVPDTRDLTPRWRFSGRWWMQRRFANRPPELSRF